MPKFIQKYKIFVASPSDVRDERASMKDVIDELNKTYSSRFNLILELVKWETDSSPAASVTDVQQIVDEDIGNDYDLFIGILWKKFGTPTTNFGSGTEQEFHNAYSRFIKDSTSLEILFYFKISPPISITDIDPYQLVKVNNFKSELGEKAILYWEYDSVENLQKFLRLHIPMRIDKLRNCDLQLVQAPGQKETKNLTTNTEDFGVIDYQDIYEEAFNDSANALSQITTSMTWVGDEINKKTSELNSLKLKKQELGRKELRDFYKRTAEVMNAFASRLEPEIPLYFSSFQKGIDAFSKMLSLLRSDFNLLSKEEIEKNASVIQTLFTTIEGALSQNKGFINSVSALPRMAKELNQARNNVETKLNDFVNKLEVSKSLVSELYKNVSTAVD